MHICNRYNYEVLTVSDNKFDKYTSRFLYTSEVRAMLDSTPVGASDMSNEIISVCNNFMWCDYDEEAWFDEGKASFYAYALALGYIPFGDAGRNYVKEKLGLESVFEYQYQTAINTFNSDNAFTTMKEQAEIWNMFRLAEKGTAKYDLIGVVNIIFSCYLTYGFGKYEEKYENLIYLLQSGEEEVELPRVECSELNEKQTQILDHLIIIRKNMPHVFEMLLTKEDYTAVIHKEFDSFLATNTEKDCKTGDVLKFKWENLVLDAKVTGTPVTDEGKYIVFDIAERAHTTIGDYKAPFNKDRLKDIEVGQSFTLILKDAKLWETLYMYETVVLTDECDIEEMTVYSGQNSPTEVFSKNELIDELDPSLPTSESIDDITEQEYKFGIVLLKVKREK